MKHYAHGVSGMLLEAVLTLLAALGGLWWGKRDKDGEDRDA
ncbi:MAG: hypothetical protein AAF628_08305 [Planctomycetota bacterium]